MNFEYCNFENQEKHPNTIEEWVNFYSDLDVENVDGLKVEDREVKATYCFDGKDVKNRRNEKIKINSRFNKDKENAFRIALHELRHKKQWDFKSKEQELEFFTVEQLVKFCEDLTLDTLSFEERVSQIDKEVLNKPREIDAIFFSECLQRALKKELVTEEDVKDLLDKNSSEILEILKNNYARVFRGASNSK